MMYPLGKVTRNTKQRKHPHTCRLLPGYGWVGADAPASTTELDCVLVAGPGAELPTRISCLLLYGS